jgi:hypothetical protein
MKRASSKEGFAEHQKREERPMPRTQRQEKELREMEREKWERSEDKSEKGGDEKGAPKP